MSGSPSTVSYSNFGAQGPTTATRSTALRINGASSGAYYNNIFYAGTAGINVLGNHNYVYGNNLGQNRYEQSDGHPGGQLFLDPGSSYAQIAANVINGNFWETSGGLVNGCPTTNNGSAGPGGAEVYGSNQSFFNNGIIQNMGAGLAVGGSNPTGPVTVTINNPWNSSDPIRCVYHNGAGLYFYGPGDCGGQCTYAVTGVTLDAVQVIDNNNVGNQAAIYLNQSGGTGFTNNEYPGGGSWIRGNVGISENHTSLAHTLPINTTSHYANWQYCPAN